MTLQRTLLITIIALAIALTWAGTRMLLAGGYAHQSKLFLQDWRSKPAPVEKAWQVAEHAARQAVALYPVANGQYYEQLGRVYHYRHRNLPTGSAQATASREQAASAYRQAIAARPQWPYSRLRLASVLKSQRQYNDEYKQALTQGFAHGPWHGWIVRQSAYLGLISWHTLNTAQQQTITTAIEHGLAQSAKSKKYITGLLTRLNRQDLLARSGE
ncbi:hypothetical protein [Oceanimonas marisflavi]|uniref:hypothetical protein n=1 Tax=Oceanimonas marisflavi TaxID=2059724 RepID=UPI000D303200|nr:hypothetical protein [Oceanimonas marisflavi]